MARACLMVIWVRNLTADWNTNSPHQQLLLLKLIIKYVAGFMETVPGILKQNNFKRNHHLCIRKPCPDNIF
jgi:hypothetical protein